MPIEAFFFRPFVALTEFLAHELELFAGMGVLIGKKQTQVCELLPHVAGHFVKK